RMGHSSAPGTDFAANPLRSSPQDLRPRLDPQFRFRGLELSCQLSVWHFGKMSAGLATMSNAEQPIPEIYREAAEQVRQLARAARLTDIRSDLLELAARFERLAGYADAAIRLGAP